MPHPVKFGPKEFAVITHHSTISTSDSDPELHQLAYDIVAGWSSIEMQQLQLFIRILGGHRSVATAAYLAMNTRNTKLAAIKAAAKIMLSEASYNIWEAIEKEAGSICRYRDKLSHWHPVSISTKPSGLYLQNPLEYGKTGNLYDGIYSFKKNELLAQREKNQEIFVCYDRFITAIGCHPNFAKKEYQYISLALSRLNSALKIEIPTPDDMPLREPPWRRR